jgi:hypothetical protein
MNPGPFQTIRNTFQLRLLPSAIVAFINLKIPKLILPFAIIMKTQNNFTLQH